MRYGFDVQKMEVEGHEFYCIKSKCLKGCVAQGETVDEALKLFEELERECIKTSKKYGIPIPEEIVAKNIEYSGKILLRIPKSLHHEIAELSIIEGVSINQCINLALSKFVGKASGFSECLKMYSPVLSVGCKAANIERAFEKVNTSRSMVGHRTFLSYNGGVFNGFTGNYKQSTAVSQKN